MKILVIADPHIPVPPVNYGGAERAVGLLCDGLSKLGHQIRLLAASESTDFGNGMWPHRAPTGHYFSRAFRKLSFQQLSLRAARGMDIVINFGRIDYLVGILLTKIPMLACFQNPVAQTELDWFLHKRSLGLRFIGVSNDQVKGLVPRQLIDIIPNVANTEMLFPVESGRHDYLAFLGRMTFNKGADTAIEVARRTGIKLKLAGTISNESGGREFFEDKIRPHLGREIEYIGPVNDEVKQRFLGEALALLFPIRWKEPFGIVMAESLACGTPVIATRCASTPEVISHGKTGFLCDSEDEMVEAVYRLGEIDRSNCRRVAEQEFSPNRLVDRYLNSIQRLHDELSS